eukprot:4931329-Pyramimonas_sp.AAC.1
MVMVIVRCMSTQGRRTRKRNRMETVGGGMRNEEQLLRNGCGEAMDEWREEGRRERGWRTRRRMT